jgi:hypothetical protein
MNLSGTFYVPAGLTQLLSNGDATIASQIISMLMQSDGSGVATIDWAGPSSARTRVIQLVE